ncbi:MAG TPA: hypothetical protein VGR61_00060 [Candidatus Dormibacteraeota bacterium]|nr:hypothetical protein [Candidatus Dormibacteraeota bacterium]
MTEKQQRGHSRQRQPEEVAAQKAGDEARLMRGEDPDTTYLEDAEHWSGVYKELLAFKQDLLDFTKERIARMNPPASNELATTDLVILEAEHERLRTRFDFWEERRRELTTG